MQELKLSYLYWQIFKYIDAG
jgi:hypothetical protein